MTREEIIEGLKLLEDNMVYFDELLNDKGEYIDVHELLFESIKALEQEPCEDAISRTELVSLLIPKIKTPKSTIEIKDKLIPLIKSLNPIQPKEIYNKGWKDGAKAAAYRYELCEEENPTIPMSVIEDIKAEIEEKSRFCPLTEGLECALEIINNHIAERGLK